MTGTGTAARSFIDVQREVIVIGRHMPMVRRTIRIIYRRAQKLTGRRRIKDLTDGHRCGRYGVGGNSELIAAFCSDAVVPQTF